MYLVQVFGAIFDVFANQDVFATVVCLISTDSDQLH